MREGLEKVPQTLHALHISSQFTMLGPKVHVCQDWFDENNESISTALKAKNKAYIEWQSDLYSASEKNEFKHLQSKVQLELQRCKICGGKERQKKSNTMQILTTSRHSSML